MILYILLKLSCATAEPIIVSAKILLLLYPENSHFTFCQCPVPSRTPLILNTMDEEPEQTPVPNPDAGEAKKVSVVKQDDETQANTRLNALLYHTSNDSIDLYKRENNSLDLMGRLYFDDYDSDSVLSSGAVSPVFLSPGATVPSLEYFNARLDPLFEALKKPERPQFQRGISFSDQLSCTFKVKHPHFKFRRNNKTFLAGYNDESLSLKAIEWLYDEMIVNGDTLIVLRVLDERTHASIDRTAASASLQKLQSLNAHGKKILMVFETTIGKPKKLLKRAIDEYKPAMMAIGTRHAEQHMQHRSFLAKELMLKHFLECALVPVIVVKPTWRYVEQLEHEIDSETYFLDWILGIDIEGSYKKKKKMGFLSPSLSQTNLASLNDRGRHLKPQTSNDAFRNTDLRSRSRSQSKPRFRIFGH